MPVARAPEQLVELLCDAARTAEGEIGLLTSAQLARVLGRRREWVLRNALRLGGFPLPGSGQWRFSPRGVAEGVLAAQDVGRWPAQSAVAERSPSRRLSYPPTGQLLGDRPRRGTR